MEDALEVVFNISQYCYARVIDDPQQYALIYRKSLGPERVRHKAN